MHLVWVVGCKDSAPIVGGIDVACLGREGFMIQQDSLPRPVSLNMLACFESDATDATDQLYEFRVAVSAPDGDRPPLTVRFDQRPDGSPPLVTIERYYQPLTLQLMVTTPGEYLVRFSDFSGERYVLPAVFLALPAM